MELFKNKKYVYIVIGIIVIAICILICIIIEIQNKQGNQIVAEGYYINEENVETKEEVRQKDIIVHIAGEVNNPGIIKIKEGSRIVDIVEKAGGFTQDADIDKVNLAYQIKDEQKIVIPNINKGDEEINVIDDNQDFIVNDIGKGNGLVNINTATQSELESLTGIGPSMASKILNYRETNGKFSSKEDIKNVPGIGNSKYDAIKDEIYAK